MQDTPKGSGQNERSLGELFSDLSNNVSLLLRQEVALAKKEVGETVSAALKDVISLVVGGAVAYIGLLVLVTAAVLGLALVIPAWASALIIGAVILLIGGIMVLGGLRNLKTLEFMPKRTMETLKEDAQVVKETVQGK